MKTILIAAALMLPTAAFTQTAVEADASSHSKINTAIRADVAARGAPASEAPATVGNVRVKTARMGEKTVSLQNGGLPEAQADASVKAAKPGA